MYEKKIQNAIIDRRFLCGRGYVLSNFVWRKDIIHRFNQIIFKKKKLILGYFIRR